MDQPFADRYWTSADDLRLHYRDYPASGAGADKAPLLCLHGLTRNARDFATVPEDVAGGRRVIVPVMRGRADSDYARDSASYRPEQYVADVEALLAELGIGRFAVIGTSLGGLMAMLLASAPGERITAAVLNDIGPSLEVAGLEKIKSYVGQGRSFSTWMHAAQALEEVHGEAHPDFTLDDWLAMAKRTMTLGQHGRISFDYDMAIAEPFRQESGGAEPPDLWLAFESLRDVPLLLVRGELSNLLSETTVGEMQARNPRMQVVSVPRTGHAPLLDEPVATEAIRALLANAP